MFTTAHDASAEASAPRRRFSTVEVTGENGRDVVDLSELNEEDQALAQFGYKPVLTCHVSFTLVLLVHHSEMLDRP